MARTRLFKTSDGQAVHIPGEIAYADINIELEIARFGDVITVYPAASSLRDSISVLRALPKPKTPERRQPIEVPMRERD